MRLPTASDRSNDPKIALTLPDEDRVMRKPRLFAAAALLLLSSIAQAFTPPPSLGPFLPANNMVVVVKIAPAAANVDSYQVSLPTGAPLTVLSVTAGTNLLKVQSLASANLSFTKFKAATLTPPQQVNPIQVQQATIYFLNNVGRPFYPAAFMGP